MSSSLSSSSSISSSRSPITDSLFESLTERIRERARERLRETVSSEWSSPRLNVNRSRLPMPPSNDFFHPTSGEGNNRRNINSTHRSLLLDLPTVTIQNIEEEIPKDCRNCVICFNEFEIGQKRKILECFHGFHETCIDQWLQVNASCPICRY